MYRRNCARVCGVLICLTVLKFLEVRIILKIILSQKNSEFEGLSKVSYESSDWKSSRALAGPFRFTELEPELLSASNATPTDAARVGLRPFCRDRAHVELRTSSSWLELYVLSTF